MAIVVDCEDDLSVFGDCFDIVVDSFLFYSCTSYSILSSVAIFSLNLALLYSNSLISFVFLLIISFNSPLNSSNCPPIFSDFSLNLRFSSFNLLFFIVNYSILNTPYCDFRTISYKSWLYFTWNWVSFACKLRSFCYAYDEFICNKSFLFYCYN